MSPNDLEDFLGEVNEDGTPVAQNSAPAVPTVEAGNQSPPAALSPLANPNTLEGAVSPESADLESDIMNFEVRPRQGYMRAFTDAVQRGARQVQATVPTLKGVAAEIGGNDLEAVLQSELAKDTENLAPDPVGGRFLDIKNLDDAAYWTAERLGEQGPILLASALGGGAGGIVAKLVGQGLIKAGTGAAIGAAVSNVGLETAGTAQEQMEATGSFNPGTSLTAGAIKGVLETYTPFKFLKEVKGMGVLGAAGRAAGREAITEGLQEQTDILARKYEDPNYSYFSSAMVERTIESMAAGAVVGGGYGAAGQGLANVSGLAKEDRPPSGPLTEEEIMAFPEGPPPIPGEKLLLPRPDDGPEGQVVPPKVPPFVGPAAPGGLVPQVSPDEIIDPVKPTASIPSGLEEAKRRLAEETAKAAADPYYDDRPRQALKKAIELEERRQKQSPLEGGPLSELRQKVLGPIVRSGDIGGEARTAPTQDVNETAVMVDQPMGEEWKAKDDIRANLDRLFDLEDDNLPRYAVVQPDGSMGTRLLTDTDLEEYTAQLGNEPNVPRIVQIDMGSLQQGAITAEPFDLAPPGDKRIWYLPGTTPEEQAAIEVEYAKAFPTLDAARQVRYRQGNGELLENGVRRALDPLLTAGMRVVPSRGHSFEYNGVVEGQQIDKLPNSRRTVQVFTAPTDLQVGGKLFPSTEQDLAAGIGLKHLALDLNKVPEDALSIDEETGVVTVLKPISDKAVTYGYPAGPNTYMNKAVEHVPDLLSNHIEHNKSEVAEGTIKTRAENAVKWWKETQPWLVDMQKRIGIKNKLNFMVNEEPSFIPPAFQRTPFTYVLATNTIIYNPYVNFDNLLDTEGFPVGQLLQPGLDTREGFMLAVMHEFGHAVTLNSWAALPVRIKQKVYESYKRALLNYRITGNTVSVQPANMNPTASAPLRYYYLTFAEFLAEQFRRYATQDAIHLSRTEKFYKSVGRKMDGLYNGFVEKVGSEHAFEMFFPDYAMNTWMEYLEETANNNVSPMRLSIMAKKLSADIKVPEDLQPTYKLVLKAIEDWGYLVPEDVRLELVEDRTVTKDSAGEQVFQFGGYDHQTNVLKLMIGSLADAGSMWKPARTLVHEAFHSIEDWLAPEEYNILLEQAKRDKSLPMAEIAHYWRAYKQAYRDEGLDPDDHLEAIRRMVDSEMIARLIEDRLVNGKGWRTEINELVDRIIQLFKMVGEFMRGNGFISADQVLRAFYYGQMTERRNQFMEQQKFSLGEAASIGKPPGLSDKVISKYQQWRFPEDTKPGQAWKNIHEAERDIYRPGLNRHRDTFPDGERAGAPVGPFSKINPANDKFEVDFGQDRSSIFGGLDRPGPLRYTPEVGEHVLGAENQNEDNPYDAAVADQKATQAQPRSPGWRPPAGAIQVGRGLVADRQFDSTIQRSGVTEQILVKVTNEGTPYKEENKRTYWFEDLQGNKLGYMSIELDPDLGWDVEMIQSVHKFDRSLKTIAADMIRSVERDLGEKLKASGVLTKQGYKMLSRLAPQQIVYHVYSAQDELWYSPRQLGIQIAATEHSLKTGWENEWGPDKLQGLQKELEALKALRKNIPPGYFKDAGRKNAFSVGIIKKQAQEKVLGDSLEQGERDFLNAVEGRKAAADPLLMQMHIEQEEQGTQPETADMLAVFNKLFKGDKNPNTARYLHGQIETADKISKISKIFFNLQQLTWRNLHIPGLRDYTGLVEMFNARRMEWISRADNTLKDWDKNANLPEREKEAITELLFWATEMEYRSPLEVRNKVVRHPTPVELAAEMQRLGISQDGAAVYQQIGKDFDEFLSAIERVTIVNIGRTISDPATRQAAIAEVRADMAQLRNKPYFPMARFGEFHITVRNQFMSSNPVVFFGTYATERERDAAVRQTAANFPGLAIQIGKIPENVHEFMGLPATLLKAIRAKLPGITIAQGEWLEQFESIMAPERSFRKRFLKRKGTSGYSLDGMRVYAHYFRSGANYLARIEYKDLLEDKIKEVNKSRALLRDNTRRTRILEYMQEHLKYIMESGNDWAKWKSLISIFQLGFSVSAAGMNLSQTPVVTLPYLGTLFGNAKAMAKLMKVMRATKMTFGKPPPGANPAFLKAREEMIKQGKIDVGQAPELGGYAEGSNLTRLAAGTKAQKAWRSFSYWSMWLFQHTERFNRELTFAAAYELAIEDPTNPHLVDPNTGIMYIRIPEINELTARLGITREEAVATIAAREALDRTQFIYQPWARPTFLRSGPASTVLVFFQYMQNMLYALSFNPGKEKMLIWLLVLYGVAGLPGSDDVDKFIKWFSRRMLEKNFSPFDYAREQTRELTRGTMFDAVGPDLLMHGISRYSFGVGLLPDGWGAPRFDASGSGSMGNIIPGLAPALQAAAAGKDWKEMTAQVGSDVAGAGFGQMFAWLQFMNSQPFTMDQKKWERIMPRAAKAASKAYRYATTGADIDPATGAKFAEFNTNDPDDIATIAAQLAGFTPTKISEKWEQIRIASDLTDWIKYRRMILLVQMDAAVRSGDKEAIAGMRGAIKKYNDEMVSMELGSMAISSDTLSKSMRARAVTKGKREAGIPLTRQEMPINNKALDMVPGVLIEQKKVR